MKYYQRIVIAIIIFLLAATAAQAGKYQLAYWRELGAYENQSPPAGTYGFYYVVINVWNENGTPRAGVPIFNSGGGYEGVTDANGVYTNFLVRDSKAFYCSSNSQSDMTPLFDQNRFPHWGHCSWEVGFVYRNSDTPTGTFDTNYYGSLNSNAGYECYLHAPYTKSMAYMFVKPTSTCSDQFVSSASVPEHGQTFVATGDRIIAAKAWLVGNTSYKAQILDGGPNGTPVSTVATAYTEEYWKSRAAWSFDSVPVTPGNTYYLKITSTSGSSFSVYRTLGDNYSGGCMYENKSARTGYDLFGAVIMAWSGSENKTRVSGRVTDNNGVGLDGATVTLMGNPGLFSAQTDRNGYYTIYNVSPGTYSQAYADKWGYSRDTFVNKVVASGPNTLNFGRLVRVTNLAMNPSFENNLDNWTKSGSFNIYNSTQWNVPAREGGKWAGNVASMGGYVGGMLYQQVDVEGDYEYQLSAWIMADSFNGNHSPEFPDNNLCRIGVDPTGGTNPLSFNITWGPYTSAYCVWKEISLKKKAQPPYTKMTIWLNQSIGESRDWNKTAFDNIMFARSTPMVLVDMDPVVADVKSVSARVSWHTNVLSDSRVDYGTTTAYGSSKSVSESVYSHSVTLQGLQPNTTYHFKLSSGAAGYMTGSLADFTFTTKPMVTVSKVNDLDSLADGTEVLLPAKIVTAGVSQLGGMFYVQDADVYSGIRVNSTDSAIVEGDIRDIYGVMATSDGERCINVTMTTLKSAGNQVPGPCGMRLNQVGGREAGWPLGINTVGTLVRTWGKVVASGSGYFTLEDAEGDRLKVLCGALAKPTGFAAVTGCCGKASTGVVVRVREQGDISSY